ncbi:DNA-binding transcriptional LysR family regulator [Paucibacter oligotrophus]|uniref:DNA-binding transcriptional LysR family regulator n=1 Tax=Roseateles oligotrophus TaxID=1769250 RepID=A0A840LHJ6_9BURK|nr:LysR family transcriptional regulator [Roseateles oligotrophus]MBB4845489.1 DNA-binding transcriptional LysR family regulator [Roseateles oligotrophus]
MNPAAISHRHIEVFRAVMTAGSVTAAASLLHSSQPTLSRELARLEYLLGYALFERLNGRLKPTARALSLFEEVQRSYQGLDRICSRAAQLGRAEQAQLSVLCLPALSHGLLPGACARLLQRYPAAQLSITPQESPLLEEWMSAQRYDLGLSEQTHAVPGTARVPLLSLDEVCVLPTGHALLSKKLLKPRDFEGQDFINLAADDPYRLQLDALFAEQGVQRRARLETHSAIAVCAMVKAGLGLAIVNPVTALAMAGEGLALRRLSVSVPFQLSALLPQFRPAQALTQVLLADLQAQVQQISLELKSALQV